MHRVVWTLAVMLAGCAADVDLGGVDSTGGSETAADGSDSEAVDEAGESAGDEAVESTEETTGEPPEPFCGDGQLGPGEGCDDANDDDFDGCKADCTVVPPIDPPPLEWTYFEIPGTRCMDGSVAGFAVNYNPASPDVMIYLEGGGACFSDSCDFMAFSIPFVPPSDGIFSRSNPANPVADWTMIYVPYCSGDIHAGDAERELGGQLRQFRGYSNITRFLERWVPSFPAERLLLAGISAGGFGAALNATQVADAYDKDGEGVALTVIDDSGPPLSDAVIPPCLQTIFRETWNLDATVLDACPTCDPEDFATGYLEYALTHYPDVHFGVFSNAADTIIRTYMGAGWGNGMHDNCGGLSVPVPALVYSAELEAIRAANLDSLSTFYVAGLGHTALRVGFNVTFAGGVTLPEWIGAVIDGEITHVGP